MWTDAAKGAASDVVAPAPNAVVDVVDDVAVVVVAAGGGLTRLANTDATDVAVPGTCDAENPAVRASEATASSAAGVGDHEHAWVGEGLALPRYNTGRRSEGNSDSAAENDETINKGKGKKKNKKL